jgi:hypothetical protein
MAGNELISIAGILGTLGGTGLGAWISWKIHVRTITAQEEARFHEQRLEAYTAYVGAANVALSRFSMDGAWDVESRGVTIKQFELIRLVGDRDVVASLLRVHMLLLQAQSTVPAGDRAAMVVRCNAEIGIMVAAIRRELGIQAIA